jgi:serine protease
MTRLRVLVGALGLVLALVPSAFGGSSANNPNDEYWEKQWGPRQIKANDAWSITKGSGTIIAVVDSGVDLSHPDLKSKLVGGATFWSCADKPDGCGNGGWKSGNNDTAPSNHGTHVAGIAAAATNNGIGIAGVAPAAKIMPVKVINEDGGSFQEVAAGIRWAADHGADVINLSLGALPGIQALVLTGNLDDTKQAINYAVSKDVAVIAAAGNEFGSICAEPAFSPNALCVVATDRMEKKAVYSNFAFDQDFNVVAAPGGHSLSAAVGCGENILSTVPKGSEDPCGQATPGYDYFAGTSMASPHVAGVAALLKAQGRDVFDVYRALKETARTPGTDRRGYWTPTYGYGIVDAAAALNAPPVGGGNAAGTKVPDDPLLARQWGLDKVNAIEAWPKATGQGVTVAIVDSGVDLSHADLKAKLVGGATFWSCADKSGGCGNGGWKSGNNDTAPSNHGTHVAGITAATTNNGVGIAGVARDAKIMPVKVINDVGGSYAEVAAGVRWAADHGADVINMSLGDLPGAQVLVLTGLESQLLEDAIADAVSKGVVVIAAAGNDFASICGEPSFDPGAMCVVATDPDDARAAYSNFAVQPEMNVVAAPGGRAFGVTCEEDVLSSVPVGTEGVCSGGSGYAYFAGTSMAAPHVAGVAALLKQQGRGVAEVYRVLKSTAYTPGTGARGMYTPTYGFGIVDAQAAVNAPRG